MQAASRNLRDSIPLVLDWWSMNNSINPKPEAAIASASLYMPSPQYNYRYSGSPQFVTCVDHFLGIKLGVFHASLSRPKSRDSVYLLTGATARAITVADPLWLERVWPKFMHAQESSSRKCLHQFDPLALCFSSCFSGSSRTNTNLFHS